MRCSPPVGYAVVDPARQVRYATLDPVPAYCVVRPGADESVRYRGVS